MSEQEKAIKFYEETEKYLKERARSSGVKIAELEWYYEPSDESKHNLSTHIYEYQHSHPAKITTWQQSAMMSFAFHAQNQTGNHIGNIVKFRSRVHLEKIYEILEEFKPEKIKGKKPDKLVDEFKKATNVKGERMFKWEENSKGNPSAIFNWCTSVIESAKFICEYQSRTALIDKMKECYVASKKSNGEINLDKLRKNFGVFGFGTALTCDLFKEFDGCFSMIMKPDLHIKDVLDAYDDFSKENSPYQKNNNKAYNRFIEIVNYIKEDKKINRSDLTAYKLDKMIWLSCTGSFYMHSHKSKEDYINIIQDLHI